MDFKQVIEKILYCTLKGKKYDRILASRNFKFSWFEKHFKTFKHTEDTLAFPNHYLYSVKRKNQVIDVFDLPLSSICREITIGISKEGLYLIPKCSCGRDFILLTFIKRIEENYPIWFCSYCSELRKYKPCTLHYHSSLKFSEKEVSQLKEILEKIRAEIVLETEREKEKELEDFIVLIDEDIEEE
jgi:hypothetical protein